MSASPADSTRWRPYQLGFSAAAFVTILEEADAPEQYQLYGRYRMTRAWTARTALQYRHRFDEEHEVRLAARAGVDRVLRDGERLQLYAGADLVGGYDRFRGGDRTYRVGAAPVFGVLLRVTPYLSLSVEPRLVATYSYFDNRSSNLPDDRALSLELKGDGLLIVSVHF